jgi:serine phosphatase RsbU (regulator of sigma subunit)
VFVLLQILIEYELIQPVFGASPVFVYGMLGQAISMSVFLSYNIAATNKRLEKQIVTNQQLSEQALAHERHAAKQEMENRLIEAENEKKSRELESARELQLSLLPAAPPAMEQLDIACFMKTATEVGGDYYDFFLEENGALTIAIGDATGHGLKAGNMVIAMKGVLGALMRVPALDELLRQANNALKNLNAKMLMMCLALVKIEKSTVHYTSAGMPPVFILRRGGAIEELLIKAMPLGAFKDFHYSRLETHINAGDTILMASDGLYELFNGDKEVYGRERVLASLKSRAGGSANEIVSGLLEDCAAWSGAAQLEDDLTIIVIKAME